MSTVPILQTRPLSYERLCDLPKVNQPADVRGGIWAQVLLTALMWHSALGPFSPHRPGEVESQWGVEAPNRQTPGSCSLNREILPMPARPRPSQGGLWDLAASSGPREMCGLPRTAVLNWGWFCSPGDIWPCLEILWIVTTGTASSPEKNTHVYTHMHTYICHIYTHMYTYI